MGQHSAWADQRFKHLIDEPDESQIYFRMFLSQCIQVRLVRLDDMRHALHKLGLASHDLN